MICFYRLSIIALVTVVVIWAVQAPVTHEVFPVWLNTIARAGCVLLIAVSIIRDRWNRA